MAQAHDCDRGAVGNTGSSALYPDPDAHYVFQCRCDLNALEPMVAQPYRVDNVAPVSAVRGRPVHQAWLGTCTNGQLDDIAVACALRARFVRGVTGGAAAGLRRDEAGGVIGTPSLWAITWARRPLAKSRSATPSATFAGDCDAVIYLASPAVVVASAVVGAIADPREVV